MNVSPYRNRNIILCIIACLLFLGIPASLAIDAITTTGGPGGTIIVASYPDGAAVYLNGDFRGLSPVEMKGIPPGDYRVNVSMNGYHNESFTTTLFHGSTRQINVNLIALSSAPAAGTTFAVVHGVGSIAVDSSPGSAAVTLDGKAAGTTPASSRAALVLNNVPDGEHTVKVELAGYPAYTETVSVVKNHVVKVEADFVTRTPTIYSVTTIATTDRPEPVPLSPLVAVAAAGFAGLAVVFRRG